MRSSYKKAISTLNPAQKDAVEHIDGPLMVVAGPGTGKTHVLAARIARILEKTDTPPYAILALTFTESAAVNMRNRVVQMIGKQGYYVNITTFHSFCSDVIKTHPEYFPIQRGSEPLSELEKYDLFENILTSESLNALRPMNMPLFYIKDCIYSISQLKREGISHAAFEAIVQDEYSEDILAELSKTERRKKEQQKRKNLELAQVYKQYDKLLREKLRYDFDDMIALVVDAFNGHELLLREYQERLHYFLVDEYQDTNSAQNKIVDQLASYWGEGANVCVVGDPNQSIFRFQGASIENSLSFVKSYPGARVITLDTGYRCPQTIYDAAHAVISENKLTREEGIHELHSAVTQNIQSVGSVGEPIQITVLPSQTLELVFITEEITRLIRSGVAYEDIAILYRNNAEAVELQHALEKWQIPYEIEGGENILEAEVIRQLLQLMYVVMDVRKSAEDEKLFEVMSYAWTDVDPVLAMKIARAAGKAKKTIVELVDSGYEEFMKYHQRNEVTAMEFHIAEKFIESVKRWSALDASSLFTRWFEAFINESGYLAYILEQENKVELLLNINSLFREIKSLVSENRELKLSGFLKAVSTMRDHKINIFAEDMNVGKGVVHISTVHKAKGREWAHVFVMNCIDKRWGNSQQREKIPLPAGLLQNTDLSKKELNEDDRRLFYVAMTRASEKLYISYAKSTMTNHTTREVTGSMFIEEIPEKLKVLTEPQEYGDKAHEYIATLLKPQAKAIVKISDEAFFRDILKNFKLSVTALNTYLKNTDEFVKNSLLKVPRAKPPVMAYGSAMHAALEKMNKAHMADTHYSKTQLLADFEQALQHEPLSDWELTERLKKGKEKLGLYFDEYNQTMTKPLFTERFFGYGFSKAVLDDIPLVGRVDKVELIDTQAKSVRVVDYKTGRARTHNEIEGKTQSSDLSEREATLPEQIRGPYKRQLLFYALLAELDQTFPFKVTEGVFDFVEPDSQTLKFTQRSFPMLKDDILLLKDLIYTVMKEIRELTFLEKAND